MLIDNENDFDIIYFERKKYNICPQFTAKCLDIIVYKKNLFFFLQKKPNYICEKIKGLFTRNIF